MSTSVTITISRVSVSCSWYKLHAQYDFKEEKPAARRYQVFICFASLIIKNFFGDASGGPVIKTAPA